MKCFTFYKGVFTPEQLRDYLDAKGEVPECEMFKYKEQLDDERIKNSGFIADETCDDEIFDEIPETLSEALGYLCLGCGAPVEENGASYCDKCFKNGEHLK